MFGSSTLLARLMKSPTQSDRTLPKKEIRMSSLLHLNRVLPCLYPEIFPSQVAASGEPQPHSTAESTPAAPSARQAQRLKSLYQRSLRNQHSDRSLTYSGTVSA